MKKILKRSLSILLAITLIFGSASVGLGEVDFAGLFAVEAEAASVSDLIFQLNRGGKSYSVMLCDDYATGEIVIPSTYNDLPVTSIGDSAFWGCTSLTSITIPDSVTSIGDWAFYDCDSLTSITIPDSVRSIGDSAFWGCTSLTSITIPDSVTSIGEDAFRGCTSLTSITIPDSVRSIGDGAFYGCTSLTSITIPDSVRSIGDYAFGGCTSLTSITIPDSVRSIGEDAFRGCTSLTSITIPDSVTSISGFAFDNTGYYNDTNNWENDVLYIGNHLIEAKDSISGDYVIKEGTKTIARSAFEDCTSLTSITIPDSVTSIDYATFRDCTSLTSVTIPDSVTSIDDYTFYNCTSLTSVIIGNGVTSIGEDAFYGCTSLTSITIPDSVTSIGSDVFYNTGYYNDTDNWENDVLYIGNHLIKAKDTISGDYVIKEGTKTIAGSAFHGCTSLTSVTIPDSVTSIGWSAFCGCTSLKSVTIPDSVTSIDRYAFYNCKKLKYVFYGGTKEDKVKISIDPYNGKLTNAIWHYEATGHSYSDWMVDKKATVNAAGKKHKECTVCGKVLETATIPQLKCGAVTLSKVANVTTGVRVYWSKVTGADSYRVYRKVKGGSYKVIGNTTKAYYTDKTAKSGTTYYYSVRAINEAGLGATCKTTKTLKCLADPTLKVPTSSRSGITLKWTKTAGASGYVIYRKAGNGSWKKLVTEKGVSNLSYVDKSAKKGTTYTYKVRAYYGKTYSAYSNTRQIKDKY